MGAILYEKYLRIILNEYSYGVRQLPRMMKMAFVMTSKIGINLKCVTRKELSHTSHDWQTINLYNKV